MAKEKFDFEAYAKWCKEKHLVAEESSSLEKYKAELENDAQKGEKGRKIAEQKELFEAIAKHIGVKVKYNEKYYGSLEKVLAGICYAMEMCSLQDRAEEVQNRYGLGIGD